MALFPYEWRKSVSWAGLLLVALLMAVKLMIFLGYRQEYPPVYNLYYQEYLTQVEDMGTDDAILALQQESNQPLDRLQEQARVACLEQLQGIQYREYVQAAAQKGSTVTYNMPLDYFHLMDHYAILPLPQRMNTAGWNLFFQLNAWNLLPLVVLFLFSPMVAMEQEGRMFGLLRSTSAGTARLLRTKWAVVAVFSSVVFHLLFVEDLALCSFVLPWGNWELPLSSVFSQIASPLSLGEFLVRYYWGSLLYLLGLTALLLPVSSCFSSGRMAVCVSLLIYGGLVLANGVLPPSSLLKLAIGDLAGLYERTLLLPLEGITWEIDLIGFGCYWLVSMLCGAVSWQLFRRERTRKERLM